MFTIELDQQRLQDVLRKVEWAVGDLAPLMRSVAAELGSIAENAGALGAPMPQFLMRAIAALRAGISDRGGGDGDGGGAA